MFSSLCMYVSVLYVNIIVSNEIAIISKNSIKINKLFDLNEEKIYFVFHFLFCMKNGQ